MFSRRQSKQDQSGYSFLEDRSDDESESMKMEPLQTPQYLFYSFIFKLSFYLIFLSAQLVGISSSSSAADPLTL